MAGIEIEIKVDDLQISRLFEILERRMKNMKPIWRAIGEDILEGTKRSFEMETSPEGKPWKKSRRAEEQGGETLRDRGILYNSIHAAAGNDQVIVGTPVIYAATHQFGAARGSFGSTSRGGPIPWGDIPARPFLGISDETLSAIRETLIDFVLQS
jgi:phage virion morphogenesis protein